MSDQFKLLIDLGNTSLKYARFDKQDPFACIDSKSASLSDIDKIIAEASEVFICSVKSDKETQHVLTVLDDAELPYTLVETKAEEFGIRNSYPQIQNMGCDRWMAIIGASALTSSDIIVIDAGTAITCDFVAKGQHVGGWIAPGLSMLRSAVVENTHRVFDFDGLQPELLPGNDTANCVANGALAQIIGMIMQASSVMQSFTKNFSVILTGGDQEIIFNNLKQRGIEPLLHDNLVLAGLARICKQKAG